MSGLLRSTTTTHAQRTSDVLRTSAPKNDKIADELTLTRNEQRTITSNERLSNSIDLENDNTAKLFIEKLNEYIKGNPKHVGTIREELKNKKINDLADQSDPNPRTRCPPRPLERLRVHRGCFEIK